MLSNHDRDHYLNAAAPAERQHPRRGDLEAPGRRRRVAGHVPSRSGTGLPSISSRSASKRTPYSTPR